MGEGRDVVTSLTSWEDLRIETRIGSCCWPGLDPPSWGYVLVLRGVWGLVQGGDQCGDVVHCDGHRGDVARSDDAVH